MATHCHASLTVTAHCGIIHIQLLPAYPSHSDAVRLQRLRDQLQVSHPPPFPQKRPHDVANPVIPGLNTQSAAANRKDLIHNAMICSVHTSASISKHRITLVSPCGADAAAQHPHSPAYLLPPLCFSLVSSVIQCLWPCFLASPTGTYGIPTHLLLQLLCCLTQPIRASSSSRRSLPFKHASCSQNAGFPCASPPPPSLPIEAVVGKPMTGSLSSSPQHSAGKVVVLNRGSFFELCCPPRTRELSRSKAMHPLSHALRNSRSGKSAQRSLQSRPATDRPFGSLVSRSHKRR
ncbi:hypothetical protein LX32DRAFT_318984 [Colletotrichum zoysiae]|uniref:Uncharacterized protein n=1 Tax=Colletotrichum zoysiae TaxID=1216348 RepID=A0AAD9H160_9PEZI|nr:hypothetical protein LX32DRAFT_318984 [Colletotrichum zoysiae]